jgi:hypothetical protein
VAGRLRGSSGDRDSLSHTQLEAPGHGGGAETEEKDLMADQSAESANLLIRSFNLLSFSLMYYLLLFPLSSVMPVLLNLFSRFSPVSTYAHIDV